MNDELKKLFESLGNEVKIKDGNIIIIEKD